MLYHHLLGAGVRIYEYCERPLHGKVALMDDEWATVGSSNLDPLSLSLNLEANVIIRDRALQPAPVRTARAHHARTAASRSGARMSARSAAGNVVRSFLAFHFTRLYPGWATWLPRHVPRLLPAATDRLQPAYAKQGGEE